MSISTGDRIPETTLLKLGAEGPEQVDLGELAKGRKLVIFAVPGAFTGVCHNAHMPSFVKNMDEIRGKGVDEVICVSVNDPFVMGAWGEITGATEAGITMLSDAESEFTKAMGMDFTGRPAGLIDRSKRYAMIVEDGTITALEEEENPGQCDLSSGDSILGKL
ncbi:peroxiredoxin [Roseovarius sp. SCSIO 43702]|uniref:peroxiredoxin n=1 Tax=Roseovarius sp. SCSIO 43702 TaxID=2823043 RepID=UPI001C737488|nr:peroxiredoxin [Roseovarius sp. SCSIO 43702]QYX56742.1 peroxiredoxin [Roseovarius sp. SCSIO 43702]